MSVPRWLHIVQTFAPMVLAFTPAAPLAPFVAAGIQAAEQIPGATGPQKLAIATAIAQTGIAATNAQLGHEVISPALSTAAIQSSISLVVDIANKAHASDLVTVPAAPGA